MNYELANGLKDAGFPQKEHGNYFRHGTILHSDSKGENIIHPPADCYIPTLEELIELCKGTIIKLWILADGRAGVQLEGQSLEDVIYYSTPTEAVARLWLALNKK
jgi:hypothetical protein